MKRTIIAVLAAAFLAGCSTDSSSPPSDGARPQVFRPTAAREVYVTIDATSMSPSLIETRPGESVRLLVANPTNQDSHITIGGGGQVLSNAETPARATTPIELVAPSVPGDYNITFSGGVATLRVLTGSQMF